MGAGFEHENPVVVAEGGDFPGALEVVAEVSFVVCQYDAEAGEGNFGRQEGCHFAECLAVGDDEVRRGGMCREVGGEFLGLQDDGDAAVVEDVAEHLYLGQDQSACGSLGVDGRDEQYGLPGVEQGA